jgi:phage major head subunit gpT-like protein
MAITVSDIAPELLEAGLRAEFFEAFQNYQSRDVWKKVCTVIQSTQDTETYAWLGALPRMFEFIDERLVQGMQKHAFTVPNRKWESTIGITREALEDGHYAQIKSRIQQLATAARLHYDELLAEALLRGETTPCYDGANFFAVDHTLDTLMGPITMSNLGSYDLDDAGLSATRAAMTSYRDDKGKVLGVLPNTLIVPPQLEDQAVRLLNSRQLTADGQTNVHAGRYALHVLPELSDDASNMWFMAHSDWRGMNPFVLQERSPVEFTALEGNSEAGFYRDEYVYGVRARYNIASALWFLIYANKTGGGE